MGLHLARGDRVYSLSSPNAIFFTATDLPLPKVILSAPSVTSPAYAYFHCGNDCDRICQPQDKLKGPPQLG
jgi:hypothetical protein